MKSLKIIKGLLPVLFVLLPTFLFSVVKGDITLPGAIKTIHSIDMDMDGKDEIVIFTAKKERSKTHTLVIYSLNGTSMKKVAEQDLKGVSFFDFADWDNDGIKDLIDVTGNRLGWQKVTKNAAGIYKVGSFKKLLTVYSLYSYPLAESISDADFAEDYDHDGKMDVIIPVNTGYSFYKGNSSGFAKSKNLFLDFGLAVPPFQRESDFIENNTSLFNIVIPKVVFKDYNSDGLEDVVFIGEGYVKIYPVLSKGLLSTKAINLKIPKPKLDDRGFNLPLTTLVDFNGDKYMDIITMERNIQREGGIKATSALKIYFGKAASHSYARFDLKLSENSILPLFPPVVKDFNNDGRKDILTLRIDFSIFKMVSTLINKTARAELEIYHQGGSGLFYKTDYKKKIKVEIQFEPPFVKSLFNVKGDFTGDGNMDFLYGDIFENTITVNNGKPNGQFDSKTSQRINHTLYIANKVVNLNGDKKDDLIMFFPPKGKLSYIIF